MKSVFLYGAGIFASEIIKEVERKASITGILDTNEKKWGSVIEGYPVLGNADYLKNQHYDEIILSAIAIRDITHYLIEKGVPEEKISSEYVKTYIEAREYFVKNLAEMLFDKGIVDFSVAEGGVYKGEFAKVINESFPNNPLYLFDTFEGFNNADMELDEKEGLSKAKLNNRFKDTNEKIVLEQLPHPEKVVICKGYFPETTKNLQEMKFGFVNLDFDLYKPTLEGLRYFYPKMIDGGVILIHDYFGPTFTGVKRAVKEFTEEQGGEIAAFPIGDRISIAITKKIETVKK